MVEFNLLPLLPTYVLGTELAKYLSWVLGAIFVLSASIRSIPGYHKLEEKLIASIETRWRKNTRTISIYNDDSLFYVILSWASKQEQLSGREHLIATVDQGSFPSRLRMAIFGVLALGENPVFTPGSGVVSFLHLGQVVWFMRSIDRSRPGEPKELIEFSTKSKDLSLTDLIIHINREDKELRRQGMEVYRAVVHDGQKEHKTEWRLLASQSRRIETVALTPGRKEEILEDLESFLRLAAAKWYSSRGIPYRRGYLFTGPPGTGKTSLCMALATYFKLPIYQVTLGPDEMNDIRLAELFDSLPPKCLLLLEDIDAFGLKDRQTSPAEGRSGVSLSGLLNLIDGVGAPEGRVLIMTTNYIDKLDKALLRPGRIEKIYNFELADEDCAKFLFRSLMSVEEEGIEKLALEFARKIPIGKLSPADLQNYLTDMRDCPDIAVSKVEAWVEQRLLELTDKVAGKET